MPRTTAGRSTSLVTRKSVPITPQDVRDLELLRDEASPLARSFAELAGGSLPDSEAAVLHGLLALGLERVRQAAEEAGYAALAQSYATDPAERAERAAGRRHRGRGARARASDE